MIAAGAYLRTLREGRGLTRDEVAYEIGTSGVQVMRIEKGEVDTRGSLLMALAKRVHANVDHISRLLLDEQATAEDGQQLAAQWLTNHEIAVIDSLDQGELGEFIALLDEIRQKDDQALATVRRMLRGLVGR